VSNDGAKSESLQTLAHSQCPPITCEDKTEEGSIGGVQRREDASADAWTTLLEDKEDDGEDGYAMDDETDVGSDCGKEGTRGGNLNNDTMPQGSSWESRRAPSVEDARKALQDLQNLLRPRRQDQTGYHPSTMKDTTVDKRLHWEANIVWCREMATGF
ncbi:hypothetical protein PAXRUDRAFT_29310, partial [Paxillus rubicundulus Ve08.2h10]